uniref:BTB domain-containing protein n=1 Tax=Mesocestoides corti TaxID=53468 RepID=A0A5K3FX10_MESCO
MHGMEAMQCRVSSDTVHCTTICCSIVEAAVTFAYTGRVEITMTNVASLFLLSTTLGCSTLTTGCIEFLEHRLSVENVEIFWSIANATLNSELMGICVPVIADNFDDFTGRSTFNASTDAEYLALLLKDDRLCGVPEYSKLRVIATWCAAAATEDGEKYQVDCFKDLVQSIDLRKFSIDVCAKLCASNQMNNLPEECSAWMSSKTSPRSSQVASSPRNAFRDYLVAYQLPPHHSSMYEFENILGEKTDVNLNFQVSSLQGCLVTFFKDSIYFTGGYHWNGSISDRVDRVNPFSGSVSRVSPMSHARYGHCAAANDQYLFVFGAYSGELYVDKCEKYDPIRDRWTRLPDMITRRSENAAVNVPDVGIVVVGGWQDQVRRKVNFVELLSPSMEGGNDWSWKTLTPMLQWRIRPAVAYFRGCVIVAGGNDGVHATFEYLTLTSRYHNSSQWTQLDGVNKACSGPIFLAEFNGRLIFAAWDPNNKAYNGEMLECMSDSGSEHSELGVFTWKPFRKIAAEREKRLLVLRRRL